MDAAGFQLDGYGLRWDSIANGQKGPTQFDPGAFGSGPLRGTLLWQHDTAKPIGTFVAVPDGVGLRVSATIADTQLGRDAATLVKTGSVNAFSVGFTPAKAHPGPGRVARVIDQAQLDELSLVTFGADPAARVASIDGEPVPQFHAAPAREYETTAHPFDAMAEVRAAEAALRLLTGKAEPALEHRDVCGRVLSPEALAAQRRGRELLNEYERNGMSPWMRALRSTRPGG